MFLKYENHGFSYVVKFEDGEYQLKIIDTDFEEIVFIKSPYLSADNIAALVIDVYEKRKLNVAANLALLFQFLHLKDGFKISMIIGWNKMYNTKYLNYSDEVEKYMIWI